MRVLRGEGLKEDCAYPSSVARSRRSCTVPKMLPGLVRLFPWEGSLHSEVVPKYRSLHNTRIYCYFLFLWRCRFLPRVLYQCRLLSVWSALYVFLPFSVCLTCDHGLDCDNNLLCENSINRSLISVGMKRTLFSPIKTTSRSCDCTDIKEEEHLRFNVATNIN